MLLLIPHVGWTFRSFSSVEKIWQKVGVKVSLLQGGERDVFREEKIQKERNLSRGPMTKGHLTERSFLDLIQMREIGTKKSF